MKSVRKMLSALLTLVLVVTLLPPLQPSVHAAPNLEILYWTVGKDQPAEPSRVTTQTVDIEFNYTEINSDELHNLYYEITNINTGVTKVVRENPAFPSGTRRAVFRDVELTEGLNKIIVRYDSVADPQSLPAWIVFTAVATISDLKIDNQQFVNGAFVPKNNPTVGQTSVFIDGVAPNATEVTGYTTLNPSGTRANFFFPTTGEFSFSAGETNADLLLRPGDNDVVIIGSNAFKTYRTERYMVYNNGNSFFFNTKASAATDLEPLNDVMLYKQPTFEASTSSGNFTIDITTDIKVNRVVNAMTHSQLQLEINNTSVIHDVYFTGLDIAARTVNYSIDGGPAVQADVEIESDYFIIKDVVLSGIRLDSTSSLQMLEVRFLGSTVNMDHSQTFHFNFVNEKAPYVELVKFADTDMELFNNTEISITLEAIEFIVRTRNNTEAVHVYLNSSTAPIATSNNIVGQNGYRDFSVALSKSDLPEGRSVIRFVPVGAGNQEHHVGARDYLINYNPAPYVYITNIMNGQVFTEDENQPIGFEPDGSPIGGPVLQIKAVNIPNNQLNDIRVIVNGNVDKIRDEDKYPNAANPTELRFRFGKTTDPGSRHGVGWGLINGLNTIRLEVYPRGTLDANGDPGSVFPITTFEYELFFFTDKMPEVIQPTVEKEFLQNHDFVQLEGENFRFYTQESAVVFETTVINAHEVEIKVNRIDKDNNPLPTETAILTWNGTTFVENDPYQLIDRTINTGESTADNGSARIISEVIPLQGTGTNTISVTAINSSGIPNTKILEIVREPANFVVHYPIIDSDTKIGTINGNYTRVYMEAEGATEVIYGKGESVTETREMLINGEMKQVFAFELKNLKKGLNTINLTIRRGTQESKGTIRLMNADTAVVGAEHKESIAKNRIRAFNNQLELSFPKGTILMKKDKTAVDQALSPTREVLIGIADPVDGRVNKILHPMANEPSKFLGKSEWNSRYLLLRELSGRFRPVSHMYWIDGGAVPLSGISKNEVLYGSGIYPYEFDQEFYTKNAGNVGNQFVPSQPGKLTLAYDPNIVQSAWRYITVFHYGYNEDYLGNKRYEWKNIGGVVDPKKNTITVPFEEFGYYVVMYMDRSYDDIIGHPWARNSLDTLFSKGIMKPKEATRFETNEPITRGEFTTLITKAFELPLNYDGRPTFTDVRPVDPASLGLYEYKYIETAARAGIVRGMLGNRFAPNTSITREDAAVIIARAANLKLNDNMNKVRQDLNKQFTDTLNIDDYALSSVLAVTKAGLMAGKPNVTQSTDKPTYYFDPKASMTRAEAAEVVMRVLLNAKRIPSM